MFKKFISMFISVLMILSLSVFCASAQEETYYFASDSEFTVKTEKLMDAISDYKYYILGDANNDSKVNVKDATDIQKYLVGIISEDDIKVRCADANVDGSVNILDATEIQKVLAGFIIDSKLCQELNILDLKAELLALIEQGEELTAGKPLTEESYENYVNAENKVLEAFQGDNFVEASVLEETVETMKAAIAAIEYKTDTPRGNRRVDVNGFDEYRVGPYDHCWDNVSFVVESAEELQEIFSKVDTFYMDRVELPTKYDENYFEDNALIVTFFVIGGSGSSQGFGGLKAEGDTMIIKRYVTQPVCGPCDMDYRMTLFEVRGEDVAGITQFVNETEYNYIDEY